MNKTMKKWCSMFALMLLASINSSFAQKLTVADFQVKAGEYAELTMNLVGGDASVYGFQTDIVLPKGLTMKEAPQAVAGVMADGTDAAFTINQQSDGSYRIAAFSLAGVAFKAETAVATFTVKAAANFMNVDGQYAQITLANTKITVDKNGTEVAVADAPVEADATVYNYPTLPCTIDLDDSKPVLDGAGICAYAADIQGLQVSGMQPVKGWEATSNGDGRAAGVFATGSTAFLGASGIYAPATDSEGNPAQLLGMLAVWKTTAQYTQKVFFKAGEYYLTFKVYNAGGTAAIDKNLIGFFTEDGTEYFAETKQYAVGAWTEEQLRIVLDEDTYGYISYGYTAQDLGNADMPHLFFEGIHLASEIFPSNYRAYRFVCPRGALSARGVGITIAGTNYNTYAADTTNFAVVTYNSKTYLYSIDNKQFVKMVDANLLETTNYAPEDVTITEWPSAGYHFIFGSNTLNVNGGGQLGYVINGWANVDDGNRFTVESVGDFDPTEALAVLAANEAAPAFAPVFVADPANLQNNKAYIIEGVRSGTWGISNGTTVVRTPKAMPNEPTQQFAILKSGNDNYLWSISAKKFLTVNKDDTDNNRTFVLSDEPMPVELIATGDAARPVLFRFGEGWNVNYNGTSLTSKLVINGWSSFDDGNRYAISEVGDFDPTEVMAKLPATIGDGEYVFQNVGSGQFMFGGNNWGTRVSLRNSSQYMILHQLADGKFNIESMQNNGNSSFYVGWGDMNTKDNIYVDCDIARAISFTFEPVGEGIFNIITDTDKYLAYDGTTIVALTDDGSVDAAKWTITAVGDMLKDASEDTPVNATYLIKDADFDRNNRWNSTKAEDFGKAWTMTASNQNLAGGANENMCAESWHSTFELKQTIVSAPKGVYKLSAQGFYRDDSNGALTALPVLFANDNESEFPEIKDELKNGESIRNQGVAQMSDCSTWFANGDYPIEPIFFKLDAAGDITVGMKYQQPELLWAIWDKFDLVYYGPDADLISVQIEGRDVILDDLLKEATELAAAEYPEDITVALGHAIETGNTAKATVPATKEVYQAAIDELEAAIAAAKGYFPSVDILSTVGSSYEGLTADVDVAAILAKLGVSSLEEVTISAIQSDGTYDPDYKLGTTDGWRNAAGDWQAWGDEAYFYVKADFAAESAQIYEAGGFPGKTDSEVTYTASYSFKAGENEVILNVNLIYGPAPQINYEFGDLTVLAENDINVPTMIKGSYEGLTAEVDGAAILAALGVESFDDVLITAVQSDGSLDPNYGLGTTDGWRNAAGDWQAWGDDAYFCMKSSFADDDASIYYIGGYPGKTDEPVTFTATYAFVKVGSVSHDAYVLRVNLVYNNGEIVDETEQYEDALAKLEDGKTYHVWSTVGETKYYLTETGTLTAEAADAGLFTFTKITAAGTAWETGWKLFPLCFTNPDKGDTESGFVLNPGMIRNNTQASPRDNWEAQVFFSNGIGKYAVRCTNATDTGWGAHFFWAVLDGAEGLPEAGYSADKTFVWEVEEYVDERQAAYEMVQAWPAILQEKYGVVTDASMYTSNAKDPVEGSYEALLDGDYTTFFHSTWHADNDPGEDHYLQAELPEEISDFYFFFKKRSQNNNNRPTKIIVEGSSDGMFFDEIATIEEGLPVDATVVSYTSELMSSLLGYTYIRFTVPTTNNGATTGDHVFFTFSEFYILSADELVGEAAEYLGVASYKDLTDEDVAKIKEINDKLTGNGISDLNGNAGRSLENAAIFDITGRKVSKVQKGGIYIVNGKKVAIK